MVVLELVVDVVVLVVVEVLVVDTARAVAMTLTWSGHTEAAMDISITAESRSL